MSNARTRYYYLDHRNMEIHAQLLQVVTPDSWIFLGESDAKPAVIAPLYLRNMLQNPDHYLLVIEQEVTTPTVSNIGHEPNADPQ